MKVAYILIIIFTFSTLCLAANSDENKQYKLKNAFKNLSFDKPVDLQHAGDGTNRIFVVSQKGLIYVFKNTLSVKSAKIFLDIRDKVKYGSELGLLGLAFHHDYKEEIYAYGMRNPWRFSFDPVTGWMRAGDVGQNSWEEIDIIEKGKNYGWRIMEGNHCYNPSSDCDTSGLTLHPYGNMVMMTTGIALSQVVICIGVLNFQSFMGNIYTAIIAAAGYGH